MATRLFAGRENERRFFVSMLEGKEPTRVLVITGMGGIGKTELLKQFQSLAEERHIANAWIEGAGAVDAPRALDEIAHQLSSRGIGLESLATTLGHYKRIKAKLPSPTRAAVTTVAEAIGSTTKAVPGLPSEVASAAQRVSSELAGSIFDVLKRPDVELYLDAQRRLTDQFLISLRKPGQRFVLFFDTYEKMLSLDPWLRDLAPQVTNLGVWLVIAGQVQLDTRWSNVEQVREFPLNSLNVRECRSILRSKGLTDPRLIDEISRFSYGIPLALHLAADLTLKYDIRDFDRAPQKHQIVDQLLQRTALVAEPEETRILLACAIPRALTVPLVHRLLPDLDADAIMTDLRRRPYIVFRTPGIALHDSIREFAYAKLRYENRPLFDELQKAAIAYYDERLTAPADDRREFGAEWLDQARERLYHTLHWDEDLGFRFFNELYWQIDGRFLFIECLNLADAVLRYAFADKRRVNEARWYKAHALYDLNRWEEAQTICLQVLEVETDERLRSNVLNDLGRICTKRSQLEQARDYLEAAIRLKRELGDEAGLGIALLRLGDAHAFLHTDQERKQIEPFSEALAIFERRGNKYRQADALYRLAFSYRSMGQWDLAEQKATAALGLSKAAEQGPYRTTFQQALILNLLAHMCRHRGLFGEAERHAREALRLFQSLDHRFEEAHAWQDLAHIALLKGNPEEAKKYLAKAQVAAKELNDRFTSSILAKTDGQLCLSQNRLDEAQVAFEGYLATMTDIHENLRVALAHHHLGEVFLQRRQWIAAKEQFRASIRYFYIESSATFRGVDSLALFALVLTEEGHRAGGLQLLRFAVSEAQKRGLFYVQARTNLWLARTLFDEACCDRQAIQLHLDTAAQLARSQEYGDIAREASRLLERLTAKDGIA